MSACNAVGDNLESSDSKGLEPGYGGLQGRITNLEDYWPERKIYIFAAHFYGEVEGEGSFILDPSTFPKTEIDEDGSFLILNLPPRKYVFIVGPNAESGLILGGRSPSSVISIIPDEITQMGDTFLPP